MNDVEKLTDDTLKAVSGGSHLSSHEVIGLESGTILTVEDNFGLDIGKVEYLGRFSKQEGRCAFSEYVLKCKVLERRFYVSGNSIFGEVGDECWIAAYYLDFTDRA